MAKIVLSDEDKEELTRGFESEIRMEVYAQTWGGCGCTETTIEDIDLAAKACVRFLTEFLGKEE